MVLTVILILKSCVAVTFIAKVKLFHSESDKYLELYLMKLFYHPLPPLSKQALIVTGLTLDMDMNNGPEPELYFVIRNVYIHQIIIIIFCVLIDVDKIGKYMYRIMIQLGLTTLCNILDHAGVNMSMKCMHLDILKSFMRCPLVP